VAEWWWTCDILHWSRFIETWRGVV